MSVEVAKEAVKSCRNDTIKNTGSPNRIQKGKGTQVRTLFQKYQGTVNTKHKPVTVGDGTTDNTHILRFRHLGHCFMEPDYHHAAPVNRILRFVPSMGLFKAEINH
jgi:hypothetical protein